MSIIARLFRRETSHTNQRRSFDAATGGRRGNSFRAFGSTASETLAAAAPLRSRARHAFSNNGYVANGVSAIVAEAVGAGIEPASAHPNADLRETINQAFLSFTETADAEARTDLRGLLAQMVQSARTLSTSQPQKD